MPRSTPDLTLSAEQESRIEQWLAALGTPEQVAFRCRIIMGLARGQTDSAVPSTLEINGKTVAVAQAVPHGRSEQVVGDCTGRGRKATYASDR